MSRDKTIPPEILDDLSTRFLNNLPEQEYSDLVRVFFQVEQAYWFFLDFYCKQSGIKACAIKEFSEQIFRHCPVLVNHYGSYEDILRSWREYKLTVPRYGVIILDPTMEKCLLVRGMGPHSSWTFPKGKINEGESEVDCAIRETEEEIGYDTADVVDPNCYLEHKMNDQYNKLYIVKNVPLDTVFQTRTRNEIRSIKWWPISTLPCEHGNNHFLFVYPFVNKLRHWIERERRGGHIKRHHRSAFTATGAGGKNGPSKQRVSNQGAPKKKYQPELVGGMGRGKNVPRYSLVGAGSENDDDVVITRPGMLHQPFQQVGNSKKGYGTSKTDASPVTVKSLFQADAQSKKRSSKHHKLRHSMSGTTSGDGGDESIDVGRSGGLKPNAISFSALGLMVPSELELSTKEKPMETDETDTQNQDEEDKADESDDEEEDDDSGDAGLSADDMRIVSGPSQIKQKQSSSISWEKFVPECWKNFSFDRTLVFQAWDAKR